MKVSEDGDARAELLSLTLSQNLLCCKSWPFLLVLSLHASEKNLAPSSLGPSFRWQETAIRSLLRFLWSADLPFHVSTAYPPVFAICKTGCILFWCLGQKMLNSISPTINPKEQRLASCQLDFKPLTTTPCAPAKPPSFSPTLQFTHLLWTSSVWLRWEIESL